MHSSIFVLVLVLHVVLTKAEDTWDRRNSNFEPPPSRNPPVNVMNIGNGIKRHNVVIIDERLNNMGSPSDNQNGRFNNDKIHTNNRQNPGLHRTSINNIGNGYENHNTVVTLNGAGRTIVSQNDDTSRNTGGTFRTRTQNGEDIYHVGYGPNNYNRVIINGRPIQPDYTDSKDNTYFKQRENTQGEGTPQLSEVQSKLNELYSIAAQLQQKVTQIMREVLNLKNKYKLF